MTSFDFQPASPRSSKEYESCGRTELASSCTCHPKPGAGIFDRDPGPGPPLLDRHVSRNVSLLESHTRDAVLDRQIPAQPKNPPPSSHRFSIKPLYLMVSPTPYSVLNSVPALYFPSLAQALSTVSDGNHPPLPALSAGRAERRDGFMLFLTALFGLVMSMSMTTVQYLRSEIHSGSKKKNRQNVLPAFATVPP